MNIDYAARNILATRQKLKEEKAFSEKFHELEKGVDSLKGSFTPLQEVSSSTNQSLSVNGAMLAYMKQSSEFLYTLLENLPSADEFIKIQGSLESISTSLSGKEEIKKENTSLNSHIFQSIYDDLKINIDQLGCVMIDLEPLEDMSSEKWKKEKWLYTTKDLNRPWINGWVAGDTPHITLLYGLLKNAHTWGKYIQKVMGDWKIDEVEIDSIGYFDNPYVDEDYYCLVAHIKVTPELEEGHDRLEFLPHINTFTGYMPHMTLCYIKKDDIIRDGLMKKFTDLWVGKKLKVKKELNLGYLPKEQEENTKKESV